MFTVSLILELFIHPFSSGFYITIAVIGGMNLFLATSIATTCSMIGGVLYYLMGKSDKRIIDVNKYSEQNNSFLNSLYRNDILLLFLLIATTGHFTVISLIAGNLRMNLGKYFLIAFVGRFAKLFLYALFGIGVLKVKTYLN
ncbi:MAG: VTT domain-containing protein [Candidatus Hodarchaeota archaeon]